MRILICDDEQRFCAEVRRVVEEWKIAMGIESVFVDEYNSSEDLLEDIKNRPPYDLAFLDIQFPGEMNGLELAKLIRAGNEQISIVFISNYEEYAVDGYTVNALRFLYKPAKDDQIRECLDIAWHQYQLTMGSFVMVESKQQLIRLPYKSIRYVESRAHYLEIHLTDSEESSVVIRRKLPEFLPELASQMFVQCHRSYVVNLMYVQKIAKPAITLTDGTYVPVHMKYRENVFRAFRAFYSGRGCMKAFWTVFEIGVNCFQGWMFTWFIYRMLTIRPERTRKQIAVSSALTGFLFAAGLTVYLYVDIPVTDSVLFVLLFMYALYLFEGEWYVKLAWTIIDCVMMVMSTTLFTVLFISITGVTRDILTASTGIRIAFVIMANAFMFSVYYAISKVRWRQDRLSLPPLLLFLGLAISLLICQEMQYSMLPQEGVPQKSVSISIIFISVISGGILVLFAMLSSQAEKRAEMEIQANTAALTRKHYSEIKGMYQGMLQQQHDMKHQINALEEMIAEGNLAESTNYLSQLRQTALPLRYATGCVSVDALLSAKTAVMRQSGIDFEYTAYPLNELPIEETLFCALVGNLLENAIEGVQRIYDAALPKVIHLRFARSRDVFFISCRNTVARDTIRQRGETFLSSKRRSQQGLGIPSIRSTVQSAGGNSSFGVDGEWFTAEIELPYN